MSATETHTSITADELAHAFEDQEPEIDLRQYAIEDWATFALFWLMAFAVFLQFFTRYVLNSSLGWTEEIARYLLIAVTFIGSAMAVRKRSHIAVEFFYRWLDPPGRHRLALAVDAICLLFFGAATWITANLALRTRQFMSSVDLPKNLIYWAACLGFVGMTYYAARNLWHRYRSPPSEDDIPHSRLLD